jgi:hypothetical protein
MASPASDATNTSIIVLLAWLALGAALSLAGHHRARRPTPAVPARIRDALAHTEGLSAPS